MTKRYLINEREAQALADLVDKKDKFDKLGFDAKTFRYGNFPFRCKLLEAMGATTAAKANAAIYFLGDSTANIIETAYVVDDSSSFSSASSGDIGLCIASSEYHVIHLPSASGSGGMAWKHGGVAFYNVTAIASSGNCIEPSNTDHIGSSNNTTLSYSSDVGGIVADVTGLYKLGFSLTARSTLNDNAQPMLFRLYNITTSAYQSPQAMASCIYIISTALTHWRYETNIALSCIYNLTSGHTYNIRNNSTFTIGVSNFHFWMERFTT